MATISKPVGFGEFGHRCAVAGEDGLEWLFLLPLGVLRGHLGEAGQRELGLSVYGMFGPEGSVLIEGGDAVGGLDVFWTGFVGGVPDEIEDDVL